MTFGKKFIIFFCLICVFLLSANFVLALEIHLEIHYPDILGHHIDNTSTLGEFICYFFALGMDLAFLISVIVIAFGGVYYLISYGRGKFTSEAKEWIKAGVTGLLIVVCSALIVYTINPTINTCKLDFLPLINFNPFGLTSNQPIVPVTTYDEIPIGTLTENLLTRTMDCYAFDQKGNPVDGDPDTEDILEPTYLNHDRADCLTQLMDGAQKRAQVIAELSNEVIKLMDSCDCTGKCDPVCNPGISSSAPTNEDSIVYGNSSAYATASLADTWTNKNTFLLTTACTVAGQANCGADQHCNMSTHTCVPGKYCSSVGQAECGPTQHCNMATNTCVDGVYCSVAGQANCGADQHCNMSTHVCAEGTYCSSAGQSTCPSGQHCDMSTHVCAEGTYCTGQSDCPGQHCENHVCVGCTDNSGCATDEVCSPDGTCVPEEGECIDDWDCADDEFCSPDGICVPEEEWCIDDWDCADDEFCSPDGICVPVETYCEDDTECAADETCLYGSCVKTGGGGPGCGLSSTGHSFGFNQDCTGSCAGSCIGGACKQPSGTQDCCPAVATNALTGEVLDPQISVKQQIEHGPIEMAIDVGSSNGLSCETESADYAGLDEFRCPNPIKDGHASCDDIKSFVETQTQINGGTVTIINGENWDKLNLMQRLMYFKEKIEDIKKQIADDEDVLNQARITLNDCYLAKASVDFLKVFQGMDQKQRVILKNPEAFSDPVTNEPINASKYCSGFNYANSSCLKKCNDQCPDTSQQALGLYGSDTDIKEAYNQRPCPYGADDSQTFEDCLTLCQLDCADTCSAKYTEPSDLCENGSDEYNFCINQCTDNGQCVLDNTNSCLFGDTSNSDTNNFVYCSINSTDQGNTNYCINNIAYLCKNGSDQYAGYTDCAEPSNTDCSYFTDQEECGTATECTWDGTSCLQNHSASFFYDNPDYEKCYVGLYDSVLSSEPADEGTACYSDKSPNASCQSVCPETLKCPSSSQCPACPCDRLSNPDNRAEPLALNFSVPIENLNSTNAMEGRYSTQTETISAHQMVGPQCNGYSYSDDPLTFYCESGWWDNSSISNQGQGKNPIGQDRICSAEGESPVGQTVDDARKWADKIISDAEKMQDKIQDLLQ